MGLAFVDLLVLLTEGRGGRFQETSDGGLRYLPSGAEPRVWAGSRRGVPFHSKISVALRGEPVAAPRFFTADAVGALLAEHAELDFRSHLWTKHLDRHQAMMLPVLGPEHDRSSAPADLAVHEIPVFEGLPQSV